MANKFVSLGSLATPTSFAFSQAICDYSGMVFDARRRKLVFFGGGHSSTNYNGVLEYDIDAATWGEGSTPTPAANMLPTEYNFTSGFWQSGSPNADDKPAARHTVGLNVMCGTELIVMAGVEGNYPNLSGAWSADPTPEPNKSNGSDHKTNATGRIAHFDTITQTWSQSSTAGGFGLWPAAALDPPSNHIIVVGGANFGRYNPQTKVYTVLYDLNNYPGAYHLVDETGGTNGGGVIGAEATNLLGDLGHAVYFPPDRCYYYFANQFGSGVYRVEIDRQNWTSATTRIVQLTTTGTAPAGTNPVSGGEAGFAYDATNRLIVGAIEAGVVHAFNPATKAWSTQTGSSGGTPYMNFHCIAYDTVNNCHFFVDNSFDLKAYRWA